MNREATAIALGIGFGVLLLFVASRRKAGAMWFALAACSSAALLWLYDAGPRVTYQHVHLAERWASQRTATAVALAALGLEVVCVAVAFFARARELRAWWSRRLGPWRTLFLVACVGACSSKLREPALSSACEFVFVAVVHAATLGAVLLGAWAIAEEPLAAFARRADAWLGPLGDGSPEPGGPDAFAWRTALASTLAAALLCFTVYDRHPHVPDEVVYLIHARYLAAGELSLPAPPVLAAFDVDLMMLEGGRWYSPVNPGWPFALALGAPFGAEWLVNPLLGGLAILVVYSFLREVMSRRNARVATMLLAASPWFVFLNMSFMTHTWTLVCAALGGLGVARARRTGKRAWAWLAGAGVGMVATIRPLEGLVLALCLGLWSIGLGGARLKFASLAGLVLGTAFVAAIVLPYNAALTGSARVFPINHYVDTVYGPGKNDLGFGPEKGLGWGGLDPWPGHSPLQAAVNAQFNTFAIDVELFGWASGSLLLVWIALVLGKRRPIDRAWIVFVLAILTSNSLYWFAGGPDFGARYWYLVIVPLIALAVAGLNALAEREEQRTRLLVAVFALVLGNVALFMPWRAVDKYVGYRGMVAGVRDLARDKHFGRSLVLIQGERHPDYASAAIYNPLDLEADAPIYAWDKDVATRAALLAHYADRPIWLVAGPSVTQRGFEIVEGPLPPGTAPSR
ncbi:MAG: glycosyltransferase family 39 protein [Planctomycetes bacterium]|nr:glycosyltransferase family 39 protein [Planctomycetota bacterium]